METVTNLFDYGIVAGILGLSLAANVFQYKQYTKLQDQRVKDAEVVRDSLLQPMKELTEMVRTIFISLKK